jgi:casein kinase 1
MSGLSLVRLTIRRPSEGQSPKDDLESLLYTIVWVAKLTLPWAASNKMGEIRERKSITKGSDLCEGFPDNFVKFFDYVRGLKHGE